MNNRIELAKKFADTINSDYIKKIILFGSVARGEDTEESDIDILIVSNHKKEIEDLVNRESFQIILDEKEVISPHIISESRIDKINNFSFMKNVKRDGIVIGCDNENT